ncbi:MAG: hypothetical protein IT366_21290 [Candidatus Hydrogenedentes bacterium]|nr:hypothetical protein [Candidatus Hydrogenedentota bacterium]
MSTTTRCAPRLLLAILSVALLVPGAWAFHPHGFFDPAGNGTVTYVKWPLSAFDTNGDDDVQADEGLVLNFEIGNGEDGFDQAEANKVLSGYDEWQLVSTSYVGFQMGQNITDPVELTSGTASIDAFNIVAYESEDDIAANGSVVGDLYEVTLSAYTYEQAFVTIGTTTVQVPAGRVIDVDSVFSSSSRDIESGLSGGFKSGAVYAGGLTLGIGYSPLDNIDLEASELAGEQIENRVVAVRNFDGSIGLRGTTSSLFNEFFFYDDGGNNLVLSMQDLAPDDIAGITFMYPRTDQDLFFDLNQRARTQARDGFPSQPISGAWIRAWADTDNNNVSSRVPMFDTLTGTYSNTTDLNFRGHFELKGLFKQLETINEQSFAASYTVTCSEFLPLLFTDTLGIYDSTHGAFNDPASTGIVFDTLFPAEVFNENGNLLGLASTNQGTPLVFNLQTRKIVSQTSGKTLDVILATGRPMFGSQDQTCPLNVIVGPPVDDGGETPVDGQKREDEQEEKLSAIRAFRDDTLLGNGLGVAIADTYYRIAPAAADYLLGHNQITVMARKCVAPISWVITNAEWMLGMVGVLFVAQFLRVRTVRRKVVAAGCICMLGLFAPAASALMEPIELSEFVTRADDIVTGKVVEVESRWVQNNTNIVTNIAIQVGESIKGTQNKDGVVHLQYPTGRVGAVVRNSPDLPEFKVGEEVLVFLAAQRDGYRVVGGTAGKLKIAAHPRTGEKYVFATSMPGHIRLEREIAKMKQEKAPDGMKLANTEGPMKIDFTQRTLVKLDDFVKYLRGVDKEQAAHTISASSSAKN